MEKGRSFVLLLLLLAPALAWVGSCGEDGAATEGRRDRREEDQRGASGGRIARTKASDRSPRVESPELGRLRRDLEDVSIPGFRLHRSTVMHSASHLQKCIAEADPDRPISIRVKERKSNVPKFLQTNEEYLARGPKRVMHGYDLRAISAWQMVERLASDYSMEIRAGAHGIVLVPRM